ncbi:unnamed protein product [Lathyrus oleraceus]
MTLFFSFQLQPYLFFLFLPHALSLFSPSNQNRKLSFFLLTIIIITSQIYLFHLFTIGFDSRLSFSVFF